MVRFEIPLRSVPRGPEPVPCVVVGLGPIGIALAEALLVRPDRRITGAVDPAPTIARRPLDRVLNAPGAPTGAVLASVTELSPAAPGEVAVHAAGSDLERVRPTLEALLDRGYHVVTTCEALFHPTAETAEVFAAIDARARAAGRVVVAGGVNPGFAMDVLPLTLATAMRRVDAIAVERTLDARTRRRPLQEKMGVGEDPDRVRERLRAGTAGHVGLLASALFLAERFGWGVDAAVREAEPIVAAQAIPGPIPVSPGRTAGIAESVRLTEHGRLRVSLRLVMAAGSERNEDRVRLEGDPPLEGIVPGGLPGDAATVGEIVNLVGRVGGAPAGIRSVADLPLPRFA